MADLIQVINGKEHGFTGAGIIYIGRENKRLSLKQSALANPFVIGACKDGSREDVIKKYRQWLYAQILDGRAGKPVAAWEELKWMADAVKNGFHIQLACYCHPQPCHGDVVKSCLEWMLQAE